MGKESQTSVTQSGVLSNCMTFVVKHIQEILTLDSFLKSPKYSLNSTRKET